MRGVFENGPEPRPQVGEGTAARKGAESQTPGHGGNFGAATLQAGAGR